MIESIEWLRIFIQNHQSLEYLIVFLGVVFGGELVLFILGFFIAQGFIPAWPVIVLGFFGTFVPNLLWFFLGKTAIADKLISHRFAHNTILTITEALHHISNRNRLTAIIIIKFLVGTPFVLIMYVNKIKLGFRRFVYYQSIAIFLSLLIVIPIGFLSGLGFTYFSKILKNLYAGLGFLLLIIVIIIMVQLWTKRELIKNLSSSERKNNI